MGRIGRWIVGSCVVVGLVGGAGAVAAAKPSKQSTTKYAKTVCGLYVGLAKQLGDYATSIGNLDPTTPAFAGQATNLTNTMLGTVRADETTLKNTYPDISNGKKVGGLFASNVAELDHGLVGAQAQLAPGTPAAASMFVAVVATLGAKISDPFSKVTDQGLLSAFKKEPSCKSVVTVF